MLCNNCGAELRPGAHFCNRCGARQLSADTGAPPIPVAATDTLAPSGDAAADGGPTAKLKRPPRVPRSTVATLTEDEATPGEQPAAAENAAAPPETPAPPAPPEQAEGAATDAATDAVAAEPAGAAPAAPGAGAAVGAPSAEVAEPARPSAAPASTDSLPPPEVPDASAPTAAAPTSGAPPADWEDEETREYDALGALPPDAALASPQASALPPLATLAKSAPPDDRSGSRWDPDGFSWPLPVSIIKGGRYRVEAVVRESPADGPAGENVYRVRDLQGYERCWSCGAEYGPENAGDTFCQQCGADMLARPYLMYEHRLADDEAPAADAAPSDAGAAADAAAPADERRFVEGHRAYRVVPDVPRVSPFPRGLHLVVGLAADVGATRAGEQNEDSQAVLTFALGLDSRVQPVALAVVADGLGGHASGQEASQLVVRTLTDHVARQLALPYLAAGLPADLHDEQFTALLAEGARAANVALCQVNDVRGEDMGSTLVAALVVGETAYIANAGDSRCYAHENGELRRLTTDHSLVEQLIVGGYIKPEERYTHPHRNQVYKSLGDDPALTPDTFVQRLTPGARLLLCSDGLWEMVRDDEIAAVLAEHADPQAAADELVRRANANGGEDNISAIIVEARA